MIYKNNFDARVEDGLFWKAGWKDSKLWKWAYGDLIIKKEKEELPETIDSEIWCQSLVQLSVNYSTSDKWHMSKDMYHKMIHSKNNWEPHERLSVTELLNVGDVSTF